MKPDGRSDLFCSSAAVLWMGGAEKCVPADLLLFVREDQLEPAERRRALSRPSLSLSADPLARSIPSAGAQRQLEQLRKTSAGVGRPHVSPPLPSPPPPPPVFALLQGNRIWGMTSNIHAPRLQMRRRSQEKLRFASSSRGVGPSSLQQEGAAALDPHQEETQDLHTEPHSVNHLWSQ